MEDKGLRSLEPMSVATLLDNTVKLYGDHPALAVKKDGTWK